jgi:hypothetical protein
LDVAALNAAEARLEVRAASRCFEHAQLLREVLALDAVLAASGAGIATTAQVALLLQVSEAAAHDLLAEGRLLTSLPGALEALDCGLLTVGQSAVLLRAVGGLAEQVRLAVWARLQARLLAAHEAGEVLPPARLAAHLARWVVQADPRSAEQRRRAAEADGDVSYRRREDGVGDLFATGIPAPVLQAVVSRIRDRSRSFGSQDDRTAGKRRLDALLALLLGHDTLPLEAPPVDGEQGSFSARGGASCGCRPGTAAPCGVGVTVLVPLGAALGTTDEVAELVGHGPLHPDQLAAVLSNAPVLRAVGVDEHGVPVAVDPEVHRPGRGDLTAVREVLQRMAGGLPGPAQPRHPFDHPHRATAVTAQAVGQRAETPPETQPQTSAGSGHAPPVFAGRPQVRAGGHPPDTPGPYRLPRALQRLVRARAPYCEWPGCGVRAERCDVDHDRAWPAGATCACQCGPLCRRHHRIKQLLMLKTRTEHSAVRWTDPTGRTWTGPAQHQPPGEVAGPLPADMRVESHSLSPGELTELLAEPDDHPVRFELRRPDRNPDERDHDPLAARLSTDSGWGLVLDDPYRWTP